MSFESTCEPRLCSSLQPQARKPILKISIMQLSSHQSASLPNRYIRFVTCMTSPNLIMPPLSPCPLLPLAQTFLCPLQSGRNEGSESVESHHYVQHQVSLLQINLNLASEAQISGSGPHDVKFRGDCMCSDKCGTFEIFRPALLDPEAALASLRASGLGSKT